MPPAVKQLVPPSSVPMLNRAGGNVTHITALLAGSSKAALVLSQAISFGEMTEIVVGSMKLLECVNLLEEIKVALITPFERLVGFLAAKNVHGALAQARIFSRAECIPVFILANAHEPRKEFRLFLVGPMLCTLATWVEVVRVSIVEFTAAALDDLLNG